MLAVLAIGLGPVWFAWVVVLWAPLVSLARVTTGVHYLSDIIAGIVVGLLAGGFMLLISPLLLAWFPFIFVNPGSQRHAFHEITVSQNVVKSRQPTFLYRTHC